ncbi:MAG: flagellar brake protein [Betaproteobacteria bacterium]|nr:flagellar brake protein [Betaproteobacteria bacterium]
MAFLTMQENVSTSMNPEDTDIYSQYLLHSQAEIVFVLRDAMKRGCMLTAYFDEGESFVLTSILAASPEGVILDYGGDAEVNQRVLQAPRLLCLTSVERVKVQFALNGLTAVRHENRPAFFSVLPDTLLRLQRREYFRIGTPIANPAKCNIPIHNADGSGATLQIPLIDISAGGVGLSVTTEQVMFFEPNQVMEDCMLSLHDGTKIPASLIVRNAFEVTTRSGLRYTRVGCEYQDLHISSLNIIQRYITRLEQDRKIRLAGMI